MSKDTNSFGHDKALACESRGFVYKKRGCIVLTHPHTWLPYLTPNGVTHLTMLLIDIKILQNRAGKNHGF